MDALYEYMCHGAGGQTLALPPKTRQFPVYVFPFERIEAGKYLGPIPNDWYETMPWINNVQVVFQDMSRRGEVLNDRIAYTLIQLSRALEINAGVPGIIFQEYGYMNLLGQAYHSRKHLDTKFKGVTFGLELEMVSPLSHEDMAYDLKRAFPELNAKVSYDDGPFDTGVKEDGSIECAGDNDCGCGEEDCPLCEGADAREWPVEIALRALPYNGASSRLIARVCRWLREQGCKANSSCGVHVHISHPAFARASKMIQIIESLRWFWHHYGMEYAHMLPASRRENSYCRPTFSLGDKYCMLGVNSLMRHGTVEFRAHAGSLRDTAIWPWIGLCVRLIQWAATNQKAIVPTGTPLPLDEVPDMTALLKVPKNINQYVKGMKRRHV